MLATENQWTLYAGRVIETPRGSFTIRRGDDWRGSPVELDDAARLAAAAPAMLAALRTAELALRWAAQEASGKVRREVVGGWLHHADEAAAAIAAAERRAP